MRNSFCSKLTMAGVATTVACAFFILPADARRAYDSSGSSSSSTTNSSASNSYLTPSTLYSTTPSTNTSSTSKSSAPTATQYTPPQSLHVQQKNQFAAPKSQYTPPPTYMSPRSQYTPQQNQYTPPQNQYTQGANSYPQQNRDNGTNFYGISPAQLSRGAIQDTTNAGAGGGGQGGYDPRWNPNFGTGVGAQEMARGSNGLAQSLRENFPLQMSGDEAQMFQVNDFAARSNGGMQNRPH
ncbi:MAG: hypothetical protein JST89_04120 [Cyanobacteria bacterium SZAS-4]|nr:hypothetical protein [Cyanobacteria bacterium SZAS-4]